MKGSAQKFLNKAIGNNGTPRIINIDKSGANKEAIKTFNKRNFKNVKWRQCKYLNNIVEQDHRHVKRRIAINTGFKDFESAQIGIPSHWQQMDISHFKRYIITSRSLKNLMGSKPNISWVPRPLFGPNILLAPHTWNICFSLGCVPLAKLLGPQKTQKISGIFNPEWN